MAEKKRHFVCPTCRSTELFRRTTETTESAILDAGDEKKNVWYISHKDVCVDRTEDRIVCGKGHELVLKDGLPVDIETLEQWFEEQGPVDDRGEPLPADLVLLPNPKDLDKADFEKVMGAAWWEIDGVLCASAEAIDYLSEDDPLDAGVDVDKAKSVCYIPDILHRGNEVDGFYHA